MKRPVWLNDPANYHNRGNISGSCDQTCLELGDFAGLDDLATERQQVLDGLADVSRAGCGATSSTASASTPHGTSNPEFFEPGFRGSSPRRAGLV